MDKRPGFRKRIALELFRSIRRNRAKLHELRTLFWECTLRCNASCRHCGSDCHVSAGMKDMPVEDFLKVIDDITPHVNPNKVLVIFTGGEALVRKDIETCGMELYRRGYPWGIVSNGLLMTRERLDALLASGMHSATISLDGFEEAHNWLRRHPKSFENAVNAICMLAEEKEIVWDVVTCVNQKNFKDLKLFKEFLTEMGVKRWRLFTIFPVGRAAEETDLRTVHLDAQLHPLLPAGRKDTHQLRLRRVPRKLRSRSARLHFPVQCRNQYGFGAGRRFHFRLSEHSCQFPSGEYLQR